MTTRRQLTGIALGGAALAVAAPAAALTAATPVAASPRRAAAQPPPGVPEQEIALTAVRTAITLPNLPSLGVPYTALLDLFDEAGTQVGTALAPSTVVGVTLAGPVVQASVVLRLPDGEIHYQRVINRFGGFPRTAVGAILGGTGAYQNITGEVAISWPDDEQVDLLVRPGA